MRLRLIPRIIIASSLLLAGATGVRLEAQQRHEPLRVADVLGIAEFTDRTQIDLSPDGSLIAFTLQHPQRAASGSRTAYFDEHGVPRQYRGTDVYVTDVNTGSTRRLSDGRGASWGPVWSPDGGYLAFYSDRDGLARVWLWDRTQDAIRKLSNEIVRPFWGFEQMHWSPAGGQLLVKLLPEAMSFADVERLLPAQTTEPNDRQPERGGVTARVFSYEPAPERARDEILRPTARIDIDSTRSFLNVQLGDIAVIDVPSGRTQRIARRVRAIGYRFSPAGDRVAFTTRQPDGGTGMLVYNRYDVWVVDVAGGSPRLIAPTVQEYGLGFSWSPEGTAIAYTSDGVVHVVRAADGEAMHTFERAGVALEHEYRAPLWLNDRTIILAARDTLWQLLLTTQSVRPIATPDQRRLLEVVAPAAAQRLDGAHVIVAVSDSRSKRMGFQRIDIAGGTATPLYESDIAIGATDLPYQLVASRDGRTIAFVAESGARPPDVWIADADFARVRRLTDLHAGVSRLALGTSRLVEWTDSGEHRLRGALLLPAGYEAGKRYPLVVKVYGGSLLSGRVNRFGLQDGIDNLQLLATRGYAVLLPDAPARVGTPMTDIAAAVLAGVDSVIAMGVADPERIAILGHSYGGYSVLGIAVQSPRFHAVISSGGFSNLFSQYTEMREDGSVVGIGWSERSQGRMGGHPWEHHDRYHDNSPFFFLDRVNAPVLLLHGQADRTVLPQRAQETFVGLRRLGKEVRLVLYDGEEHHPGTWSVANATDYWDQIFAWLEQHLGPTDVR